MNITITPETAAKLMERRTPDYRAAIEISAKLDMLNEVLRNAEAMVLAIFGELNPNFDTTASQILSGLSTSQMGCIDGIRIANGLSSRQGEPAFERRHA